MMKQVIFLCLSMPLFCKKAHTRRMFNDIANYSAELVRTFISLSEIALARLGPPVRRRQDFERRLREIRDRDQHGKAAKRRLPELPFDQPSRSPNFITHLLMDRAISHLQS